MVFSISRECFPNIGELNAKRLVFNFNTLFFLFLGSVSFADRLKDLASIAGVRSNQLVGYGVVVGLAGTGDGNTELPCNRCSL